jgi:hypothetical protein
MTKELNLYGKSVRKYILAHDTSQLLGKNNDSLYKCLKDWSNIGLVAYYPFNGNANDLISLLSSSFFFELSISQKTNFTVNGGTIAGTQPTFSGAPMFYGSYVKIGNVVHFEIQVDFDNILTFGTGQYFVELPFEACCNYQLRDGCIHDNSTGRQYSISGHVDNGSKVLTLNYTGTNGRDEPFTHNNPFVLNVADNFHIAGTYMVN